MRIRGALMKVRALVITNLGDISIDPREREISMDVVAKEIRYEKQKGNVVRTQRGMHCFSHIMADFRREKKG